MLRKKILQYDVIEDCWYNNLGRLESHRYMVKYQYRWLFFTFWTYVKHDDCGWGDCHKVRTTFKTKKEAQLFIEETLLPKGPKQTWVKTVVTSYTLEDEDQK